MRAASETSNGSVAGTEAVLGAVQETVRRLIGVTAESLARSDHHQVTLSQYRMLVVLSGGERTASELAADLGVTPPAITRTVAALGRRGLIARRRGVTDRRQVVISATPAARALVDRVVRERAARIRPALAKMSEQRRHTLLGGLRDLLAALDPKGSAAPS